MTLIFSYLINGFFLTGIIYFGYHITMHTDLKPYYFPALIFKILCTLSMGILYTTFYEGGDTTVYFEEANRISQLPAGDYFGAILSTTELNDPIRAIYFTRIISGLLFITKADFWLSSIYFSLVCLFSTFYFLRQLNRTYPKIFLSAIFSFLFFPSIVFWTSGLVKEVLVFASMMFLAGGALKVIKRSKLKLLEIVGMAISLTLLVSIKYYIAAIFLPAVITLILFSYKAKFDKKVWYLIGTGLIIFFIIGLPLLHPNFNPNRFFVVIEIARNSLLEKSNPANNIHLYSDSGFFVDTIINILILFISGIFRPILFESFQFPVFLATIENTLFTGLFIIRFYGSFSFDKKYLPQVVIIAGYVLILTLFITYSIPNFGTLSRFKVYYMPFLLFLILINHPLINWLKRIKLSSSLD